MNPWTRDERCTSCSLSFLKLVYPLSILALLQPRFNNLWLSLFPISSVLHLIILFAVKLDMPSAHLSDSQATSQARILRSFVHPFTSNPPILKLRTHLINWHIYIYIYKISCLLPWPHTLKKVHRGPVEVFSGLTRDLMVQNVPLDISRPLCWLWNENPYLTQGYICFYILKIFLKNWFFYLF